MDDIMISYNIKNENPAVKLKLTYLEPEDEGFGTVSQEYFLEEPSYLYSKTLPRTRNMDYVVHVGDAGTGCTRNRHGVLCIL